MSCFKFNPKFMLIKSRSHRSVPYITMDDEIMVDIISLKYLGMMLDKKLQLQCYIELANNEISQFSGIAYV